MIIYPKYLALQSSCGGLTALSERDQPYSEVILGCYLLSLQQPIKGCAASSQMLGSGWCNYKYMYLLF